MARRIIHADLDAFFAAVEQLDRPELRGQPVVVGGPPEERGVVAAASYEARRFGVRSATPMRTALRLCPEAVRIAPRFRRYAEVSRLVMVIFREFTPLVEQVSLDEAFLDVSERPEGSEELARDLKRQVQERVGLTVSVGVASSKSVAKIASDFQKPDGLTVVPPGGEREFLAPLPVQRLWGVGPKTAQRLAREGITTIGELAARSEEWAVRRYGRRGRELLNLARGVDDRPVVVERETKSVSSETTFPRDLEDSEELRAALRRQAERTAERLRRAGLRGKTVRLKLRLADFTTFTRQTTLSHPTDEVEVIVREAARLLGREVGPGRRFRLLGVGVSHLEGGAELSQAPLFPAGTAPSTP